MRFFSLVLTLFLVGCVSTQPKNDIASLKEFPLDLCNYGYEDYDALKAKFDEMFPKGADVSALISRIDLAKANAPI